MRWVLILFIAEMLRFSSAEFSLTILHTNDMHARFEQTGQMSAKCSQKDIGNNNCYGGFARVAYAVKEAKRLASRGSSPPVIFLNAGDTFQGSVWYTVLKWRIVAKLSSMLHIDAMSLGNHEFDDGVAGLVPFINNVSFPILASNLDIGQEPTLAATHLDKSVVLTVEGRKVGVIGYLTTRTQDISSAGHVVFSDEVQSVRREAEALKRQGVNIIIALGHAGYEMDLKIAKEVAEVDVVVGGHSHTFLYDGRAPDPTEVAIGPYPTMVRQSSVKQVPVVQAYAFTKYLGNITLRFNDAGNLLSSKGNPILLDNNVPQDMSEVDIACFDPDDDVLKELHHWKDVISLQTKQIVGFSRVRLNGVRSRCRTSECNMGNLITDAMINYYVSKNIPKLGESWTEAPIAFQHGGGIRASIDKSHENGAVTIGDLLTVLPFDNSLVTLQIKGADLWEMLEWSVYNFDVKNKSYHGAFLQVSGLRITYDVCRPSGHRVVSALARCGKCWDPKYKPVNASQVYGIIVPDYLAHGGDGYTFGKKAIKKEVCDISDTGALGEYIKKVSPIYPSTEGRITILDPSCAKKSVVNGVAGLLTTYFLSIALAVTFIEQFIWQMH